MSLVSLRQSTQAGFPCLQDEDSRRPQLFSDALAKSDFCPFFLNTQSPKKPLVKVLIFVYETGMCVDIMRQDLTGWP